MFDRERCEVDVRDVRTRRAEIAEVRKENRPMAGAGLEDRNVVALEPAVHDFRGPRRRVRRFGDSPVGRDAENPAKIETSGNPTRDVAESVVSSQARARVVFGGGRVVSVQQQICVDRNHRRRRGVSSWSKISSTLS